MTAMDKVIVISNPDDDGCNFVFVQIYIMLGYGMM